MCKRGIIIKEKNMSIKYYFKNTESFDDDLRNYVETKLGSVEKLANVKEIKVEASERKDHRFFMAVMVFAKNGDEFRAENEGISFQECVDVIEDELKKQIRRHKGKEKDLKKRGGISLKKKMVVDEKARF